MEELKPQSFQKIGNNTKKILVLSVIFIILFLTYEWINDSNHKKEIKSLETQISLIQNKFDSTVLEKEKLKDSSKLYEKLANLSGDSVKILREKVQKEKKDKEAALAALRNLPKDVIDSFFARRYVNVSKSNIGLEIDKNTGNEIVVELVEKDHLEQELKTSETLSSSLTTQVNLLQKSLDFSNSALIKADSATSLRTKQFEMQIDISNYLKQDLKNQKKKTFQAGIKGAGIGLGIGLLAGLIIFK